MLVRTIMMDIDIRANSDFILKEESIEIPWQQGDVMIVDNMLAMHARNSFTPPRRILAAMVHN